MKIYSGKLVIELATLVELADKDAMDEKAHEGLTSELFKEISLLLGNKGYMTGSMGATLEYVETPREHDFALVKSSIEAAKEQVNQVYNKASNRTFKIE